MITLQALFVALFAANLALLWLSLFNPRWSWYRSLADPLILILPMITVFFGQPRFEMDYFWWKVGGVFSLVLGVVVIGLAKKEMDKAGVKWHDADPVQLLDTGIYGFVRHPVYLGLIFILVGWWWIFAAAYSFYFGMLVLALIWLEGYLEERLILLKRFGDKFIEYRRHTGMYWVK